MAAKGRYKNDQWNLDDSFGLGGTGDILAHMALDTDPPFTLGITGKWGSGKTSVMRTAFATLKGNSLQQGLAFEKAISERETTHWKALAFDNTKRKRKLDWDEKQVSTAEQCLSIWFSPWQHQNEQNPLIPLLLEIRTQFSTWIKLKEKAKNINRRGGLAGLKLIELVLDAAATLSIGRNVNVARGTSDSVRKTWNEAAPNLTELSDGQRFHLLFQDAVENILTTIAGKDNPSELETGARLIIFIDDLDRCEESVAVTLLESIKLYLGSRRCVFILGLDDTALLGTLSRHWQDRSEDDNRDYLDKLFQATLAIPQPNQTSVKTEIAKQLRLHNISHATARKCTEDITNLLEPNPRKLKNFTNSLCAAWELGLGHGWQGNDTLLLRQLILFQYLRLNHRPVWRLLERQPQTLKLLHRTITGASETEPLDMEGLKLPDQRLAQEMFSRAFAHVLQDNNEPTLRGNSTNLESRHRNMELEQAVNLFIDRLDRKRSDETFKTLFATVFSKNDVVDRHFLSLPDPEPAP
ncbi:hypothetical protein DJ030_02680 [bacterium endosymbiont of Escarpia laminata]|nr:MAG: hypothetical protein DJ030_02680 [bacterium endosymbiont of Escarpia laminata]